MDARLMFPPTRKREGGAGMTKVGLVCWGMPIPRKNDRLPARGMTPSVIPNETTAGSPPMKDLAFKIDEIYIPTARRKTVDPERVAELAESMLEEGQKTPIMVRDDGKRLILVEGLQRIEAAKSLGEETIIGIKVQARRR